MAQTLLRVEQVDDLAARYRDGATLMELEPVSPPARTDQVD
jgi:hypothetical protein